MRLQHRPNITAPGRDDDLLCEESRGKRKRNLPKSEPRSAEQRRENGADRSAEAFFGGGGAPPAPKFRMNHRSADAARITLPAFPTYAPERAQRRAKHVSHDRRAVVRHLDQKSVAASYARTETQHGKGHAYPEKVERDYGEPCVFPEKGG